MTRSIFPVRRRQAGFTLVELMVSLVLGLIVTAAALAMFLSNRQVYASTENLSRAQESVRNAFELMSREMRESGSSACETSLPTVNLLNGFAGTWYYNFDSPIRGYDGTQALSGTDTPIGTAFGQRINGTDAIELKSAVNDSVAITAANQAAAQLTVNTVNHGISTGDLVMLCDFDHAAIVQVSSASPGVTATITHDTAGTPGNCTRGVGYSLPANCAGSGSPYTYATNAYISRMRMERWYVGNGARGPSLFESALVNNGGALSIEHREIAEGVTDMQLQYLLLGANDYADASTITAANWGSSNVLAVRVQLTLRGANPGEGGDTVPRRLEHTVTLRNRVP